MKKVISIFILTRPLNCLITFLCIWVAAEVASGIHLSIRIVAASLSGSLVTGYGNIVNDIFDINIDRISKPSRPLAAGTINKKTALIIAIILAIIGLGLSLYVHKAAILIALMAIVLLLIYTPFLKGMSYLGNVIIALVAALAFIYGGLAVDNPFGARILSIFAFLLQLGREIVKDIQDRIADNIYGKRTGASAGNTLRSRIIAASILTILIISTFIPFILSIFSIAYLIVVLVGVDLLLLISIYKLIKTDNESEMRQIAAWLKAVMPIGLLAVFLGSKGW
jgi:geranylgeranylglycerol-phosphate geranylgeranyltransferase